MPNIGGMDVPKGAFEKLKRSQICASVNGVLEKIRDELPVNVCEKFKSLASDPYPGSHDYIAALIRIHTKDFIQTENEIMQGELCQSIVHEAWIQADQQIYAMIPPELRADHNIINLLSEVMARDVLSTGRT